MVMNDFVSFRTLFHNAVKKCDIDSRKLYKSIVLFELPSNCTDKLALTLLGGIFLKYRVS